MGLGQDTRLLEAHSAFVKRLNVPFQERDRGRALEAMEVSIEGFPDGIEANTAIQVTDDGRSNAA